MEKWDVYDVNRNKTGKIAIRGNNLEKGEYHLVVFGMIRNSDGKFIISKRAPEKKSPNTWEFTGGSAIMGDTSYTAILREIKEELGLEITTEGKLLKSLRFESACSYFSDIWYFEQDVDLKDVVCQEGEVSEVKLASKEEIQKMFEEGTFMPGHNGIYGCFKKL